MFKEGKKWTTANYNAKDKYQGKQSFEILSLSEAEGKLTANVKLTSYDKKDEEVFEKEVEFICEDGVMQLDMSQYLPEDVLESMKSMQMEIEYEHIQIPKELKVGQNLEEGAVNMTITSPIRMAFKFRMTDRKVEAREDVKVPAGTYNAFKISSVLQIDMMGSTRQFKSVEWIAEDVGAIRSESYDKKGNLTSYTVLTEYLE
ncbi:hypothetical protein GCM10011506_37630 [Marivirga lumbricoides]|nr:hypothetical protein GCM10011506_37630 [Marivirga lumbricoides]